MSRSSRQNPRLIQNLLKPIAPHSDNRFRNNFAPAFTLTEVLLAVAIVGIIAALVLPMITNNIQTKALEQLYKRQMQTIENSVKGLLVNESVDSYLKTSLYSENETPTTFDNTTGKFMKKYLQVARYCGDSNGDCFAPKYYIYQNGDKEEYTPEYKGACATLKNGTSLCMYPRTNTDTDLKIVMDLNGKKGPNVKDRDLIEYSITLPNRGQLNPSTQAVSWTHHVEEITPPCADGTPTESCCADPSTFTTNCCTAFPDVYGTDSRCDECAGSGAPVTCCDTKGASYRQNNPSLCCGGTSFEKYSECCSLFPSDPRCNPVPEEPEYDITLTINISEPDRTEYQWRVNAGAHVNKYYSYYTVSSSSGLLPLKTELKPCADYHFWNSPRHIRCFDINLPPYQLINQLGTLTSIQFELHTNLFFMRFVKPIENPRPYILNMILTDVESGKVIAKVDKPAYNFDKLKFVYHFKYKKSDGNARLIKVDEY